MALRIATARREALSSLHGLSSDPAPFTEQVAGGRGEEEENGGAGVSGPHRAAQGRALSPSPSSPLPSPRRSPLDDRYTPVCSPSMLKGRENGAGQEYMYPEYRKVGEGRRAPAFRPASGELWGEGMFVWTFRGYFVCLFAYLLTCLLAYLLCLFGQISGTNPHSGSCPGGSLLCWWRLVFSWCW